MRKIIIALSVIPALAIGMTVEQEEQFNKANIKELKKMGLPTPDSGVRLVPKQSMSIPAWQKKKELAEEKEIKANGFVNNSSTRAYELMNIKKAIKNAEPKQSTMFKSTDSNIRKSADEIPFSYTYISVPQSVITEYYGIAPVGTYVEDGWTGAVEFFKTSFANCAYTENNMRVSHGSAYIAEEDAKNTVNGKITLIDIEGNNSVGFLYRVNWFDNTYNRNLECATKTFKNDIRESTINLAKIIDSK